MSKARRHVNYGYPPVQDFTESVGGWVTAKPTSGTHIDMLDIRPGVRVLALFPHMNYKPWYALGEFVDNAIQSYLTNKEELRRASGTKYRLTVKIALDPRDGGTMRIWDNAGGIATKDYRRAFVTAEPPPNATGLSQFGIGMKSAACWFAGKWSVRTKALGEEFTRTVSFDVKKIISEGTEHLAPKEVIAARDQHFTEITLRDLNRPLIGRTAGKMKDHLASIYRVFLRRGEVEIYFNDDELEFDDVAVLSAPPASKPDGRPLEWRKDISFSLKGGHRVHGFAALRKAGSTSRAGFALFRNDRLVQGSDDEAYRPSEIFGASNSYVYQRLFGELHLVNFDVSHTKDTFMWGDVDEGAFLSTLKQHLNAQPMPLLHQAEHYRSRTPSKSAVKRIEQATERTAAAIETMGEAIGDLKGQGPLERAVGQRPPNVALAAKREVRIKVEGERWRITLDLSIDPAATQWLELFDTEAGPPGSRSASGKERRLGIRMSMTHPFMAEFGGAEAEHVEPLLRVAAGIALSETIARDAGVKFAGAIRMKLNDLLRDELSKPVEPEE